MSAIIGALRAELSASIAQFQSDMGKAADSLKGFVKGAEQTAAKLDRVGKKMSLAITAPLLLLAKTSYDQARESSQALGQVEAALVSTGGVSGKTAAELQKTATQLESISTFDDDDILRNVTAQLLSFTNIVGPTFDKAQKAVVNMASRMGGGEDSLEGAAIKVGRALNDPIQGISALTRMGVQFTTQQREQIKALVQNGEGMKAQGLILDVLGTKFDGAAEALRKATPEAQLMQSWKNFKETLGGVIRDVVRPLIDDLTGILNGFRQLPAPIQKFIVIAGGVLAIIGPIAVGLGAIISVGSSLIAVLAPLAVAFWALVAPVAGVVAAIAAAGLALFVFWNAVKKVLKGDFAGAWDEAKKTVTGIVDTIKAKFHELTTPQKIPAPVIAPGLNNGMGEATGFDLHNAEELKKTQAAAKELQSAIRGMNAQLAKGLDDLNLPKSTAQANALNAKIDEFVAKAKEAGVNTGKFSAQIAALRGRIAELQRQGLAKEAELFGRAVDADAVSVKKFASGGLDPLTDKLDQVDAAYQSLRDKIEAEIKDNAALADSNDDARKAMDRLQATLATLDDAHTKAADAARAQYKAEEKLAQLNTDANNLTARQQIRDLGNDRNGTAPISQHRQDLQDASDALSAKQIEVATTLAKLEAQREQAALEGHDSEVKRLDSEIDLQSQLFDLVRSTTADQLDAAKRINEAFRSFTDDLASQLSDMIATWSVDLKGLYSIFRQLAQSLFVKPVMGQVSDFLGGALKDLAGSFGGAHAAGGYIPPGKWGIVGEKGPEVAYGGHSGMDVQANGSGRPSQVFNITTPDANSFRRSARQIQRVAKARLAIA